MGIKIEMNLMNPEDFTNALELTIHEAVYRTMVNAVIAAKKNTYADKTYADRTNNLRSSIGFVIYKNGQLVSTYFAKDGHGSLGDGSKGTQEGLDEANSEAQNYESSGYICVLVAGMHYASSVEAKGYDVLSSSWLQFENMFTKEFEALKDFGLKFQISGNTKNVSFDEWLSGLNPGDI